MSVALLKRQLATSAHDLEEVEEILSTAVSLAATADSMSDLDMSQLAMNALCFLLMQLGGREKELQQYLIASGYTYRLSDECVRYTQRRSTSLLTMKGEEITSGESTSPASEEILCASAYSQGFLYMFLT